MTKSIPLHYIKTKAELLLLFVKVRLSSRVLSSFVRFGEVRKKLGFIVNLYIIVHRVEIKLLCNQIPP